MVLRFIFLLVLLIGCDILPRQDNQKIIDERNEILDSAKPKFKACLNRNAVVLFHFRLFRTGSTIGGRPKAVAFDNRTKRDEISIKIDPLSDKQDTEETCLKEVLKRLEFRAVYPTAQYMETHDYQMKL